MKNPQFQDYIFWADFPRIFESVLVSIQILFLLLQSLTDIPAKGLNILFNIPYDYLNINRFYHCRKRFMDLFVNHVWSLSSDAAIWNVIVLGFWGQFFCKKTGKK